MKSKRLKAGNSNHSFNGNQYMDGLNLHLIDFHACCLRPCNWIIYRCRSTFWSSLLTRYTKINLLHSVLYWIATSSEISPSKLTISTAYLSSTPLLSTFPTIPSLNSLISLPFYYFCSQFGQRYDRRHFKN